MGAIGIVTSSQGSLLRAHLRDTSVNPSAFSSAMFVLFPIKVIFRVMLQVSKIVSKNFFNEEHFQRFNLSPDFNLILIYDLILVLHVPR